MERITKYTVYKRRYTTLYDLPPVHAKRQVKFFLYKGKKDYQAFVTEVHAIRVHSQQHKK